MKRLFVRALTEQVEPWSRSAARSRFKDRESLRQMEGVCVRDYRLTGKLSY